MNGQPIGIACNSTYATLMEAIGYIFYQEYARFRYGTKMNRKLQETITRYWVRRKDLLHERDMQKLQALHTDV